MMIVHWTSGCPLREICVIYAHHRRSGKRSWHPIKMYMYRLTYIYIYIYKHIKICIHSLYNVILRGSNLAMDPNHHSSKCHNFPVAVQYWCRWCLESVYACIIQCGVQIVQMWPETKIQHTTNVKVKRNENIQLSNPIIKRFFEHNGLGIINRYTQWRKLAKMLQH